MATIAGILKRGSGALATGVPIRVRMSNPPFDDNGALQHNVAELFHTDHATAAYSFTLQAGPYRINIPATREFEIVVPGGSGTYPLDEIGGGAVPTLRQDYPYFATLAAAQAVTIVASRVDIGSAGNERPSTFVSNPDYEGPDDGVSGFYDASDNGFSIFQRE
jgi:hypothetical protein